MVAPKQNYVAGSSRRGEFKFSMCICVGWGQLVEQQNT